MLRKAIGLLAVMEEVKHNLTPDQIYDFFEFGQDTMKAYLAEHPVPKSVITDLVGRIDAMGVTHGDDVESAVYSAVSEYVMEHGQHKELMSHDWLEAEVDPLIEETLGFQVTEDDDGNVVRHPPAGLGYLGKAQLDANGEALAYAVVDGMIVAEEQHLEDLIFNKLNDISLDDVSEGPSYAIW